MLKAVLLPSPYLGTARSVARFRLNTSSQYKIQVDVLGIGDVDLYIVNVGDGHRSSAWYPLSKTTEELAWGFARQNYDVNHRYLI